VLFHDGKPLLRTVAASGRYVTTLLFSFRWWFGAHFGTDFPLGMGNI
jgi:hypothetical protein